MRCCCGKKNRPHVERSTRSRRHAHRAASVPALTPSSATAAKTQHPRHLNGDLFGQLNRDLSDRPQINSAVAPVADITPADASDNPATWNNPARPPELWLACHFSQLPFEAIAHFNPEPCFDAAPVVIHDGHHRQPAVVACNKTAIAHGISNGMPLGVAHSIVAGLDARMRDTDAESRILEMLATRSLRFSSAVATGTKNTLLLEVGGSRRLFGELETLIERYTAAIDHSGFSHDLALAPTPGAATILCEFTPGTVITDNDKLRATLARLPVAALSLSKRDRDSLNGMGLGVIGDLTRMPRDGLGRRMGPGLIKQLDQLLGHRPDPRSLFRPGQYFFSRLSFTDEVQDQKQLMQVVEKLLHKLESKLRIHASGVHQLHWIFEYHGAEPTRMTLNLSKPERDARHLHSLMNTRTESLQLQESVHTVSLKSSGFEQLHFKETELFPTSDLESTPRFDLVDRLRARLGDDSIESLDLVADHRPEFSWRGVTPGKTPERQDDCVIPERPAWLLRKPRPVTIRAGQPWLNGPVKLIRGPERIETGWWESASVRRDYFVCLSQAGRRFWVFHDLRANRWFIHGIFL